MPTPEKHARCSASSSSRWLNCTAAPTFEAQFPDTGTSIYAEQGTLAHSFCELFAGYNAGIIPKEDYKARLEELRKDRLYDPEMEKTADFYARYLWEKAQSFPEKPYQKQEVRVEFSDYVPEGFGTCDCVMIGGDTLHITDYKHGKGIPVSAANNSQMRLYALGALKKYAMFYPIKKVSMAIVQPRIKEDVEEEHITVEELLAWGEQIKPIARKAYTGDGAQFHEGTWCRFCKGKSVCRARADNMTALEDFMNLPIDGKLTDKEKEEREAAGLPPALTNADIAVLLKRGENLVIWFNDLKDYALTAALVGEKIPGYKVVEGKSNRSLKDTEKAIGILMAAGFEESQLYDRKAKSLAELEKVVGKKQFAEILADQIVRPVGKPTLVEESDKREPYNPAAADFQGVGNA